MYGLKGFTGIEITLTGPDHDLHSGMYGGAVRNPLMAMSHLLASMKDEEEVITVAGFYDGVKDLTPDERELMEKAPGEDFVEATNIPETVSEKGYTAKEHTMGRPTLEVNGLFGGYQGEGTKTIIPSTATAKITCRLVPGQDPRDVQEKLVNHIHKHAPSGVHVHVEKEKLSAKAYKVEPDHPLIKKKQPKAIQKHLEKKQFS